MKTTGKTTTECLNKLLASDESVVYKLLEFTKTGAHGIIHWRKGEGPVGPNLIRLRVFLAEHGIVPVEFANIDDTVFTFARVFAHRLVPEDEALKQTGLARSSNLYRILLVKCGTSNGVIDRMAAINSRFSTKLPPLSRLLDVTVSREPLQVKGDKLLSKAEVLSTLALGLQIIRPLAKLVASAAFTASEREAFRSQAGYSILTDTSTALNILVTEAKN